MENLNKGITVLQAKAAKFDNMKVKYTEYSARINEAIGILNSVLKEISPMLLVERKEKN